MNEGNKARLGRPPAGKEARGDYVGFRSPRELKERLQQAATAAGRSLSTEAAVRLEQSLRGEVDLYEALRLAFGTPGAEFLLLLGRAIRGAPFFVGLSLEGDWLSDPNAYAAAARQIEFILDVLRPAGDPIPAIVDQAENHGLRLMLGVGDTAAPVDRPFRAWAARIREGLGPAVSARAAEWRRAYLAKHFSEDTGS
jgi:hypothetical protein